MLDTEHKLWWAYENKAVKKIGAKPPTPLILPEARMSAESPFRIKNEETIHQTVKDTNYKVVPNDCGPFRLISSYGYVGYAPSDIKIESSADGQIHISSIKWPFSENGHVAVPITGSDYIKINTGIMVFFSRDFYLYQGPLPNAKNSHPRVMSGLEYAKADSRYEVNETVCGLSNLNAVIHKPPIGDVLQINEGEPLVWFFTLPKRNQQALEYIGDDS